MSRESLSLTVGLDREADVNLEKALRALAFCRGIVREVSDQEIIDCRARIAATGFEAFVGVPKLIQLQAELIHQRQVQAAHFAVGFVRFEI